MSAEAAYVFRHALLRDAAYQLQMPRDRARLHGIAFGILEAAGGGRPGAGAALGAGEDRDFVPHPTDAFARELADHARLGGGDAEALYLRRAAEAAEQRFEFEGAVEAWRRLAGLGTVAPRQALRRAARAAMLGGRPRESEAIAAAGIASLDDESR